ncbi:MAG: glycosyltransferase, partial [Verrucomicrobiaceae bacterium]
MPLVWCLRRWGAPIQQQVKGPDLMPFLLRQAAEKGWRVGLYGGNEETLRILSETLPESFPGLRLSYVYSPPYRPLTQDEDQTVCGQIRSAGVQLLFVGLGCPKQERWMSEHRAKLSCVMVGVGAAFSFHAGTVKAAPKQLESMGLEWLYRLCKEPRRLWRRYAKHNPRFAVLALGVGLARSLKQLRGKAVP